MRFLGFWVFGGGSEATRRCSRDPFSTGSMCKETSWKLPTPTSRSVRLPALSPAAAAAAAAAAILILVFRTVRNGNEQEELSAVVSLSVWKAAKEASKEELRERKADLDRVRGGREELGRQKGGLEGQVASSQAAEEGWERER